MTENTNNFPTETGYYWARDPFYKEFNTIVHIHGKFPFLKIDYADFEDNYFMENDEEGKAEQFIWGPKIEVPSV